MTWRLRQSLCSAPSRLVWNKQIKNWNNVFVSVSLGPFDSWRFALAPPLDAVFVVGLWVRASNEVEIGDGSISCHIHLPIYGLLMAIMNAFYRAIHNVLRQSKHHARITQIEQFLCSLRNTNPYLFAQNGKQTETMVTLNPQILERNYSSTRKIHILKNSRKLKNRILCREFDSASKYSWAVGSISFRPLLCGPRIFNGFVNGFLKRLTEKLFGSKRERERELQARKTMIDSCAKPVGQD